MILKSLTIERVRWGNNEGKLEGSILFVSPSEEVKIALNDEISNKLLAIVADGVVEASREIAQNLTSQILLENKKLLSE